MFFQNHCRIFEQSRKKRWDHCISFLLQQHTPEPTAIGLMNEYGDNSLLSRKLVTHPSEVNESTRRYFHGHAKRHDFDETDSRRPRFLEFGSSLLPCSSGTNMGLDELSHREAQEDIEHRTLHRTSTEPNAREDSKHKQHRRLQEQNRLSATFGGQACFGQRSMIYGGATNQYTEWERRECQRRLDMQVSFGLVHQPRRHAKAHLMEQLPLSSFENASGIICDGSSSNLHQLGNGILHIARPGRLMSDYSAWSAISGHTRTTNPISGKYDGHVQHLASKFLQSSSLSSAVATGAAAIGDFKLRQSVQEAPRLHRFSEPRRSTGDVAPFDLTSLCDSRSRLQLHSQYYNVAEVCPAWEQARVNREASDRKEAKTATTGAQESRKAETGYYKQHHVAFSTGLNPSSVRLPDDQPRRKKVQMMTTCLRNMDNSDEVGSRPSLNRNIVEQSCLPQSHDKVESSISRLIKLYNSRRANRAPFPLKLHAILADPSHRDIIGWLPHGRSWKIFEPSLFEKLLVPGLFRHGKYSSFMRQGK